MSSPSLSVNEFKDLLRSEVQDLAKTHGWDYENQVERGYAFQLWTANLFSNCDRGFDTEPEDSILYAKDLKADIVLEDTNRRYILIAQCKYLSLSKTPDINETEVNDFFHRHDYLLDRNWVKTYPAPLEIETTSKTWSNSGPRRWTWQKHPTIPSNGGPPNGGPPSS